MDALTSVLHTLRLRSSVYCRSELGAGWGLHFLPCRCPVFHVLYQGNGLLRLQEDASIWPLKERDVVLLPGGEEHVLLESSEARPFQNLQLDQWGECALMRWSERPTAVVLCGTFQFEQYEAASLLRQLPRVVHISRTTAGALSDVLTLMATEAESSRPGKHAVLRRLADTLFLQIVQHWVQARGIAQSGWLGALCDPLIGKALELIHNHPQTPWTIDALARAVNCSRSAFAARFTATVGEPPMRYVQRWRISLSARLLSEQPGATIGEIASYVGYASESSFCKAFKREMGITPNAYRMQP
ncbi:MAG: AraC family transcriptional regulator [Chloroflexaceae bacterium]